MSARLDGMSTRLIGRASGTSWALPSPSVQDTSLPSFPDVLADVLSRARVGTGLWARMDLGAPWGIRFPVATRAAFHVVSRGSCYFALEGQRPVQLFQGDLVFVARGGGHVIASEPTVRSRTLEELKREGRGDGNVRRLGTPGGPITTLMCGVYRFDRDAPQPVAAMLPPRLVLRAEDMPAESAIPTLVRMLQHEVTTREPGVQTIVTRLLDVLLVHVLRHWARERPEGASGWLGALRDPQLSRVLSEMHARPAHDFDVAELARAGGMSAATLKRRFAALVGEPPLAYLTRLRIDEAARQLREGDRTLAEIAQAVGYESEAALGKAFKRVRGIAPGRYRARERG